MIVGSPSMLFRYVVYQITFPKGKIYIGKNFTKAKFQDLTLRKQILFESDDKPKTQPLLA